MGMQIEAAQDAKVLEIVAASKFRTGSGEDVLDLPEYVTTLCNMAGMETDFEEL